MTFPSLFSPIALVDIAITNARNSGYEPDQSQIALFWKIARGEASSQEVSTSYANASVVNRKRNNEQFGHLSCSDVDVIELKNKLAAFVNELSPQD